MSTTVDDLLEANSDHAAEHQPLRDARPRRRIALVTCMDARVDPLPALGLRVGEAHVIRNAGGRVSDDALRSLIVSSHMLGTDAVVVMEHTRCGMATTDDDLRQRTGADIEFLAIADHNRAVTADVQRIADHPQLAPINLVLGLLYDVDTGKATEVTRWHRPE